MTRTWRKKIAVSILAMLFLVYAAGTQFLKGVMSDRYAGQPQVVGLPRDTIPWPQQAHMLVCTRQDWIGGLTRTPTLFLLATRDL